MFLNKGQKSVTNRTMLNINRLLSCHMVKPFGKFHQEIIYTRGDNPAHRIPQSERLQLQYIKVLDLLNYNAETKCPFVIE